MIPKILAFSILLALAGIAPAFPAAAGNWMPTGAAAIPPGGFLGFCVRHLQECRGGAPEATAAELTEERWRELWSVQAKINSEIVPREDPTHVWDYPTNGYGDCNKFALAKRRELIERGWPREAVLLATATTETGEGHLVVVAHTTAGDFVLDNRTASVVNWTALPYRWISMQSPTSPVRWVSILTQPIATSDASPLLSQPVVVTR
jgi:predicted transglutaminase-like cysteine proteinase